MAEEPRQSHRIVILNEAAVIDLEENHGFTALHWGYEQAERYAEFLKQAITDAAEAPGNGKPIEGMPHVRALFVKWPKATHGHFICYRQTENGIRVFANPAQCNGHS